MTTYDLDKNEPTREEIRETVEEYGLVEKLAKPVPPMQKVGHIPVFIGAEKRQFKFNDDISDEITYAGNTEDRTEELDPKKAEMQMIKTKLDGESPNSKHYKQLTDHIMEVIDSRQIELPLIGINEDNQGVRIGTQTIEDVKFLHFRDVHDNPMDVEPEVEL